MPEISLSQFFNEVFNTLGIGVFTILFIFYFLYIFRKKTLPLLFLFKKVIREKKIRIVNNQESDNSAVFKLLEKNLLYNSEFIVYIKAFFKKEVKGSKEETEVPRIIITISGFVLLYGFGILVQDISGNLTDNNVNAYPLQKLLSISLSTKKDLRRGILFDIKKKKLTHLGKEVYLNNEIALYTKKFAKDQDSLFYCNANHHSDSINNTAFVRRLVDTTNGLANLDDYVDNVYYPAKNWCFLYSENVHEELEGIEKREYFSLGIFWVSNYLAAIFMCSFVLVFCLYLILKKILSSNWYNKRKTTDTIDADLKDFRPGFPFGSIALLLIIFITYHTYCIEAENFYRRAIGYFLTHYTHGEVKTESNFEGGYK